MTEGKLLAPCLKLLRAELAGFVIIKHGDGYTSGVPDVSVTGRKKTSWLEFKEGPRIIWAHALQQLTCQRLASNGHACHIVLYEELKAKDGLDETRRTCILTPDEVLVAACEGFNHRFVLDFVRTVHAA